MSPEKRSALMARIKGTNTGPELAMAEAFRRRRLRFEMHARDLPGRPDFVFRKAMVVVFVDGDFWHGWRFPVWRDKLSEKWEAKIAGNRQRDHRNFRKLRSHGWRVIRVWEHQIKADTGACVERVREAVQDARRSRSGIARKSLARGPGPGKPDG